MSGPVRSVPIPQPEQAEVVVSAPGSGAGHWAGAPSALLVDGVFYLAYRTRLPVGAGRGIGTVVARSMDGVHFETLFTLPKESFGAESMERPALVRTPEGSWQLYVSCATPGTKHWWIEVIEAPRVEKLEYGERRIVFPGNEHFGVKDPVIHRHDGLFHAWIAVHPLDQPGAEDRMTTAYATSADTRAWDWHGDVLTPQPGTWDERGARVSDVVIGDETVMYYDGRATAAQNCEELLGIAAGPLSGPFSAVFDAPVAYSPHATGSLRYLSAVPLGDGSVRFYYEASRSDGAHDLFTSVSRTRAGE